MSLLTDDILNKSRQAKDLLSSLGEGVLKLAPGSPISPNTTVSNTHLLLDTLITFYSDGPKAAFLPNHADTQITASLAKVIEHLTNFKNTQNQALAGSFVTSADQLYAICLQYGLITFGFDKKELNDLVSDLRARRRSVRKTAESIDDAARAVLAKAEQIATAAKDKFALETDKLRAELDVAIKECTKEREDLQKRMEGMGKAREEFDARHAAVIQIAEALAKQQKEIAASATEATENERIAKTEVASIRDFRVKAKDEMDQILSFYSEIEEHQKAMRETQKETGAKFNDIAAKYEELQAKMAERTETIVTTNETLQRDIKSHLQKSIGVSLFSAFDQRRKGLNLGKWLWATIMLLAVAAGAGLSWWLARSLGQAGTGIEPAFFVKLSAIIPVTFTILFAAKQYSNERRTEEEYAFKSVISVSLEPYKDLLQRMKESGHTEQAVFVEKLLLEVFDNPVKRVYADPSITTELDEYQAKFKDLKKLLEMSKNVDPEKAKQLIDLFQSTLGISPPRHEQG